MVVGGGVGGGKGLGGGGPSSMHSCMITISVHVHSLFVPKARIKARIKAQDSQDLPAGA